MPAVRADGDLRMREGRRHEEVRERAVAMSVKEALHYGPSNRYLPMGGAKGGIDCDPLSSEARGVLPRFLAVIQPYVRHHWATGDDLGSTAELIDEALGELWVDGIGVEENRGVDACDDLHRARVG
ncbi:Glu/Leu/Phe/Val dehydrogenase dimerization domain-containing protein [Streptomyces mirabilis]|jgi:glutamate dehydrogenase (NAD(P)+)|nr:Glu/Leu/Phe/Val dehydrogenase dimerization domain-containing protein [Streptomyces mirabilis]